MPAVRSSSTPSPSRRPWTPPRGWFRCGRTRNLVQLIGNGPWRPTLWSTGIAVDGQKRVFVADDRQDSPGAGVDRQPVPHRRGCFRRRRPRLGGQRLRGPGRRVGRPALRARVERAGQVEGSAPGHPVARAAEHHRCATQAGCRWRQRRRVRTSRRNVAGVGVRSADAVLDGTGGKPRVPERGPGGRALGGTSSTRLAATETTCTGGARMAAGSGRSTRRRSWSGGAPCTLRISCAWPVIQRGAST